MSERLDELLAEAGLERRECAEELDDLDEHPVVVGHGHELEEDGRQRQVVLRILARQLANHIHGRGLHARLRVVELLLEARKGRPQRVRIVQEDLVHDEHRLLADVGLVRVHEREYLGGEVARQVGRDEAREAAQRDARLVHVLRGEVLAYHVGGEHEHVGAVVEALGGGQVADALEGELGGAHDLDDVEGGPADVVAEHLEVAELVDGVRLGGDVLLLELLLDLVDALADVLGLVLLVVANAAHQVVQVLVEQLADAVLGLAKSRVHAFSFLFTCSSRV